MDKLTTKQKEQFNRMRATLKRIATGYMTPAQIQRDKDSGLDYVEYLEYAYENIQAEAKIACKGAREIKAR